MDIGTLARLARDLGANEVRERNGKVTCTCILARWTHFGGYDTKPSMVLYPSGRKGDPIFKCMGCHEEGSVRDMVLDIWSATGRNLIRWIFEIDGDPDADKLVKRSEIVAALPDDPTQLRKQRMGLKEPQIVKKIGDDGKVWYDHKLLVEADSVPEISWGVYNGYHGKVPRYALNRGLTPETCKTWELGHDPDTKRLLFPMRDRKGRLVAISGRLYSKTCVYCDGQIARGMKDENGKRIRDRCKRCGRYEPPKYLHNDGFKRNLILYGENRRQDNINGNVYVVEGHMDMLLLWQAGYRPAVAMLGSYPGHCQIEKLIAYWGRRITLVPDGDKAGKDMAAKVKSLVADRVPVIVKELPDKADPGSLIQAHQEGQISDAELHEYLGEPTVNPLDLSQSTV